MSRNPMAREVRSEKYRLRVIKPRKGKGSYNRKQKEKRYA
jgi:stalled ribosome alternative rescue factor ArfA